MNTKLKIFFVFLNILLPTITLAALVNCGTGTTPCTWSDFYELANTVIQFLIELGVLIAVISIVFSGVKLAMSPDNPTAQSLWRDRLRTALFGLLFMASAWLIVKLIVTELTASRDNYQLQDRFTDTSSS